MKYYLALCYSLCLLLSACNQTTPTESAETTTPETPEAPAPTGQLPDLEIEALDITPQAVFDQTQLSNDALILCIKFKEANWGERKELFEKIAPLLPNCPTSTGPEGETQTNTDEATQVMTYNDLLELLGEPNELREDGSVAYYLTADENFNVVFTRNAQQAIACRYLEARG